MRPEDYLDFERDKPDIRIRGHRIFVQDVLRRWLAGVTPERIADELPGLTLEQVYATILYYLQHKDAMDAYLADDRQYRDEQLRRYESEPNPLRDRLRALIAERRARQEPASAH